MNKKIYRQFWKALLRRRKIITDYKKSIFEIDFKSLKNDHELIIFDYDDTLTDLHGELSEKVKTLIKDLQITGFKIGLVSNSTDDRLKILKDSLEPLDIYVAENRDKPSSKGFIEILNHYNVPPLQTVSIGDRLGTECYAGLVSGIKTIILVEPYSKVFGGNRARTMLRIVNRLEKLIYFLFYPQKREGKN